MRLLVTRPEPDNERTAAILRSRGHDVVLAPLLRIENMPDVELGAGPWTAILLSSANGARALAGHPRLNELTRLPVLAVGATSAGVARAAGFEDVTPAEGDLTALAKRAAQRFAGSQAPLLYPAAQERAGDLAKALSVHGLKVHTVVAYRAAKVTRLPPHAHDALARGNIDGVLHFSRRTAESYLECRAAMDRAGQEPLHYCISARAAEPLRLAGLLKIQVATQPDEASLLALVTPLPSSNHLE